MAHSTLEKIQKKLFILIALIMCFFNLHSQDVVLTPKEVYVGDQAELRFNFVLEDTIFDGSKDMYTYTNPSLEEDLDSPYVIKAMSLQKVRNEYVLVISFIPWQAGSLKIEPFDLGSIFGIQTKPILIDIPQVHIQSILIQGQDKEIQEPVGPVVIPGTTYVLVGILLFIFILLIFVIIVLTRYKFIRSWIQKRFGRFWASSNFKRASKGLAFLAKQSNTIDAKFFAKNLSFVIRNYLEGRFLHRFTAETTSSFFTVFDTLFAGTMSNTANDYLQDLYEICARCDFLHYAGDEIVKAPLTKSEIQSLIERSQNAFVFFERANDDEENKGGDNANI